MYKLQTQINKLLTLRIIVYLRLVDLAARRVPVHMTPEHGAIYVSGHASRAVVVLPAIFQASGADVTPTAPGNVHTESHARVYCYKNGDEQPLRPRGNYVLDY